MKGIESARAAGLGGMPYAGGLEVEFGRADVAALGKMSIYGDQARTQYVVRLKDGRDVFIKACDQHKDDERWLRRIAATFGAPSASRDGGWAFTWQDLADFDSFRTMKQAKFEARRRWGAHGAVGLTDLMRVKQVGVWRPDRTLDVYGRGTTWDEAFSQADARKE